MEYYERMLNGIDRPLLPADAADARIAELESIIAAMRDAIAQKDEIINAAAARIAEIEGRR